MGGTESGALVCASAVKAQRERRRADRDGIFVCILSAKLACEQARANGFKAISRHCPICT
jgi:hypothetical protein